MGPQRAVLSESIVIKKQVWISLNPDNSVIIFMIVSCFGLPKISSLQPYLITITAMIWYSNIFINLPQQRLGSHANWIRGFLEVMLDPHSDLLHMPVILKLVEYIGYLSKPEGNFILICKIRVLAPKDFGKIIQGCLFHNKAKRI